ncbi:MAG: S-layer glycoprotein N-glycosyltransferase AglJ [Haloquadratum sp.]|nr:S-layer glycoprotein N-glycosyltransferase AglJ [Haloferacaceae archaeon]MDR9444707.1 S-layer glycoprotein N-glycosyltransferase AglJ [Haloquadratum sp.]
MDTEDVVVIIPTLDEATTVGEVVAGFRMQGFDVVVVDGDSQDGTPTVAAEAGATVLEQRGRGKGAAVREAVAATDRPVIVLVDGDGTYRPEEVGELLAPLDAGAAHVIGNRFGGMQPGAMTRLNRLGNRAINWGFRRIHGVGLADILSGYRAFTRSSYRALQLTADGFGIETQMAVECAKRGVPTAEVDITYRPRVAGSETNLRPVRDGGIIIIELLRRAKTTNPLVYFGSLGAAVMLLGAVVGGYVVYRWSTAGATHELLAVAAVAGVIFGGQLLIFGFLADMLVSLQDELIDRLGEASGSAEEVSDRSEVRRG